MVSSTQGADLWSSQILSIASKLVTSFMHGDTTKFVPTRSLW